MTLICECGHPVSDHAWSGWGDNTVCVAAPDDPSAGWYGVCPCVRRLHARSRHLRMVDGA